MAQTDKQAAAAKAVAQVTGILGNMIATMSGVPGDVAMLYWAPRGLMLAGDDASVGHWASGIMVDGVGTVIQSSTPDPHGMTGVNTLVSDPQLLKAFEDGHGPSAAFLVHMNDMGAWATSALADVRAGTWYFNPGNSSQTNCTVGVMRASAAGGRELQNFGALGMDTPRGLYSYMRGQSRVSGSGITRNDSLISAFGF